MEKITGRQVGLRHKSAPPPRLFALSSVHTGDWAWGLRGTSRLPMRVVHSLVRKIAA